MEPGPPRIEASPVEYANRLAYLARRTGFVFRRYAKSADPGRRFGTVVSEAVSFVEEMDRIAGLEPSISGPMFRPYIDHALLASTSSLNLETLCANLRSLLDQTTRGDANAFELREMAETLKQFAMSLDDLTGQSGLYRTVG